MNEKTQLLKTNGIVDSLTKLSTYSKGTMIGTLGYFVIQTCFHGDVFLAGIFVGLGLGFQCLTKTDQEVKLF